VHSQGRHFNSCHETLFRAAGDSLVSQSWLQRQFECSAVISSITVGLRRPFVPGTPMQLAVVCLFVFCTKAVGWWQPNSGWLRTVVAW
jgi:uncharacterized membrane protein